LNGAPVNNFKWTLTLSYTNAISNFKGSLAFKGSKLAKDIEISAEKNAIDIGDTLALTATSETELSEVVWTVAPEDVASLVSEGTSATLTALKAGTATVTVTAKLGDKTVTDSYAVTVRAKATSTEALPIVANEGQTRVDGAQAWIYIDNSQIGITQEEAATLDWEYTIKGVSHDEASKPFDSETGTAKITPVGKHVEGPVTDSLVCLYVNFNIGLNPTWDFDLIITITLNHGGKQYVGSAKFNKNVYVASTTAE
ncbi:MAG: Ig-like domain-containing protein, partial [Mollicutes bacterium]|nr:Ig-like domain-containing protein [Mollicutes bacterium]